MVTTTRNASSRPIVRIIKKPVNSAQDKPVIKTEINCPKPNPHTVGKIAYVQNVSKIISVVIEGKILDELTKKPLSNKKFPDIYLHINGAKNKFARRG